MSLYQIAFTHSAQKELEDFDPPIIQKIFPKIENLANNPRPLGCIKLKGRKDLWRIRIGEYRAVYSIDDKSRMVDIIYIRHRKDVYR